MKLTTAQRRVLGRLKRGGILSEMLGYYRIEGGHAHACLNPISDGVQPGTVSALLRAGLVEKRGVAVLLTEAGREAANE